MRPRLVTSMSAADHERRVALSLHYSVLVVLGRNEASNLTANSMLAILPKASRSLTCQRSNASPSPLSCNLAVWEHQA